MSADITGPWRLVLLEIPQALGPFSALVLALVARIVSCFWRHSSTCVSKWTVDEAPKGFAYTVIMAKFKVSGYAQTGNY